MLNLSSYTKSYSLVFFDQVIVSACNFILTIIILRFLGIEIFGLFSFFWLIYSFSLTLQISFLISPLMTNASKINKSKINYYYGSSFIHQLIFSLTTFVALLLFLNIFSNFNNSYSIKSNILIFSTAVAIIQIQQFIRRILLSKGKLLNVTINDFLCYFILIALIFYFNFFNELTLHKIFIFYSISFGFGILIALPIIQSFNYKLINILDDFKQNFVISKWLALSSLFSWFSGSFWVLNVGLVLGPVVLGAIRASQSIVMIINLFFQVLENIIPKETSKIYIEKGKKEMLRYLFNFNKIFFLLIFLFITFIIIFSKQILTILYGIDLIQYNYLVIYFAISIPIIALRYLPEYGMRTMGNTAPIFIAYLFSGSIAIIFSKIIIENYQLQGFIFGMYLSPILIACVTNLGFLKIYKKYNK